MTVALKAIEVNGSILGKVNAFSWSFSYLFKKHSFTQRQFGFFGSRKMSLSQ